MGDESIIEISGISKSFGKNKVLNNLDLKINEGEILGLIGKSGCGKSTLMKILLGVYKGDKGNITIDGNKNPQNIRHYIGYTTQENSFYDKLTIFENMKYYANLYSLGKKQLPNGLNEHIDKILDSVGLLKSKDTISARISGGMKRRLDFAISLIHDPKILILDEPTTGLDPILVKGFWNIVKEVSKTGKTVIVSSHIFSEIQSNCTKVGIISKGKITKTMKISEKTNLFKIFSEFA
ncbi:ABC transporter ATP-binding protein [archaeon]|jgi:ABC-2 type transport system ATP-binding protein|nr:ABC transporter ATP-binding protein [archaeon]MBT4351922.1 ABC transporter ATP-binding protein [archaeon]MBT4647471.1 ABC transporter ATP-binding protein [archaeon]MBT6822032.1 ABC transporter ATP-binding protein [archaeon]MBT7391626.1 ABC transporter ATP-binding protein [archaeon]